MTEIELLDRLHDLLTAEAARRGDTIDRLDELAPDLEVYPVGSTGVVALINGYVLAAWPPEERHAATPATLRYIHQWLQERGTLRHMVHPLNFQSVKATRRLGAVPKGYDSDGYFHYELTLQAFERRYRST